jgi:hypothetical protein
MIRFIRVRGEVMAAERIDEISALLGRAEQAHARYEATELNGVYDREWPRWYAEYAVENGLDDLLGHAVTAEELAAFLASSNTDFEQMEPRPSEPWAAYTARRIAEEL